MVDRLLCRLSGNMGTPATERWSIGLHYALTGEQPDNPAELQGWADAIEALLDDGTIAANVRADWGNNVTLTDVETYGYQNTGPAVAAGAAQVSPALAGTGTPTAPFQTCRVVSLLTGLPGARNRGRIYMPALSPDMAVTGKSLVPAGYLTDCIALFEGIGAAWPGGFPINLAVYSAANDAVTPVTRLSVGDVLDTQRRRRDTLPEVYTTATY